MDLKVEVGKGGDGKLKPKPENGKELHPRPNEECLGREFSRSVVEEIKNHYNSLRIVETTPEIVAIVGWGARTFALFADRNEMVRCGAIPAKAEE